MALTNLLVKDWQTRVAYLGLDRLRRTAHDFPASMVSDDSVAGLIRKARADGGGAPLSAEQVAVAVAPHALRVSRGYAGPLRHAA